jgi:hypothetical protein
MAQTAEEESRRKRAKTFAIGYLFLATIFLIVLWVLLFWLPRINDHPQTYKNVPIFPGAIDLQTYSGSHDLLKRYTFATPAAFQEVVRFFEDVLGRDGWALNWREHNFVSFRNEFKGRDEFHYLAEIRETKESEDLLFIEITFICSCFDL